MNDGWAIKFGEVLTGVNNLNIFYNSQRIYYEKIHGKNQINILDKKNREATRWGDYPEVEGKTVKSFWILPTSFEISSSDQKNTLFKKWNKAKN